jgi:hypothetical protein
VSYRTTLTVLQLLDMIEQIEVKRVITPTIVSRYAVYTKDFPDFRYAGEATNFQFLRNGQVYAYQNGRPLIVTEDTCLLIPMKPEDTRIGEKVCYLDRKVHGASAAESI